MADQLSGILAKMGELMDRIAALPDDAYEERLQLQEEQKRLRAEAARLRERAPVDRQSLEAELEGLLARWDGLQSQRIDVVMQSGGGSQGGDAFSGAHAMNLNRQIDEAHGRRAVEDRIAEIRRQLEDAD